MLSKVLQWLVGVLFGSLGTVSLILWFKNKSRESEIDELKREKWESDLKAINDRIDGSTTGQLVQSDNEEWTLGKNDKSKREG